MKKLKKIVKIGVIYALFTGYCCYVTDQLVTITDPEYDIETGALDDETPLKHLFGNCKILFNRLKKK